MALITCNECKKEVSSNAEKCPHCGNPINTAVRCKNCGSTNVTRISSGDKTKSVMRRLFGAGIADKLLLETWECKNCNHRW